MIVAAYQVADVIGEALDSVWTQTLAPLEVVVCDDGSSDGLENALEPHRDRLVLLRKEHAGEASAKNAAARAAGGDFVVILDADDVYLPERLQALAELAAARPDLDILTTDAYLVADGRRVRRCYADGWRFEVDDQRRGILERNFVFGHAAVRRDLLLEHGGFDEAILWTTDWECWARLILAGARAGAVARPLALYRLRESSLSSNRLDLTRGKIATLEKTGRSASLSPAERRALERALSRYRRELEVAEARRRAIDSPADARAAAVRIAAGRGHDVRTRLEAAALALAPGPVGRRLRKQADESWVGAGGIRVTRPRA